MGIFNKIFKKQDKRIIETNEDFWNWFKDNEKKFASVVSQKGDVEGEFFNLLSPKLNELKDGYYFLTGMADDNTVELIIAADGDIRNIIFAEELIKDAPQIEGWKFTALKPPLDIENVSIKMDEFTFDKDNLSFYSNDIDEYPDEIDITVVHNDFNSENQEAITTGTHIFLDNYLGELNFATLIDNLDVIGISDAEKKLIPIEKLKDFLVYREKEFIEKYDGARINIENDKHAVFEATHKNGNKLIAAMNTDLLQWDKKASHPWIVIIEIKYGNERDNDGMPDKMTYENLNQMEDELLSILKDHDGYLLVGRETANGIREIFFACKDFRKPSKVAYDLQNRFVDDYQITYDIYKDKYWQTFNKFRRVN